MSQDEFDKEWKSIVSMQLPTAEITKEFFRPLKAIHFSDYYQVLDFVNNNQVNVVSIIQIRSDDRYVLFYNDKLI